MQLIRLVIANHCIFAAQLLAISPGTFFIEPGAQSGTFLARTRTGPITIKSAELNWFRGKTRIRQTMPGAVFHDLIPSGKDSAETNYFIGNDSRKWRKNVPHYQHLRQENIYPGIAVEYHEREGDLEFDWLLSPEADASKIVLRFEGMLGLSKNKQGDLTVEATDSSILYRRPRAFQQGKAVAASWVIQGNEAGIQLGSYDHSLPLIIDPETIWMERLGGAGTDEVVGGWVEYSYSVIVGNTESLDITVNGYGLATSQTDIFIAVKDLRFPGRTPNLTIMGGRGRDRVLSVGNKIIGGETNSLDFPLVESFYSKPMQRLYGGGAWDGFVIAFNSDYPGRPSMSTYIGGSGDDRVLAVSGNWFAGETTSQDLPIVRARQTRLGGGIDGFFGQTDSFSRPTVLSYWGGSDDDRFTSLLEGGNGTVRIGGQSKSRDFPLLNSESRLNGGWDGVLLELNGALGEVVSSEYWGGAGDDGIAGLASLPDEKWALVANTQSKDIQVTNGSKPSGEGDVLLQYRDGQSVIFSTYFGGSRLDKALGVNASGSEVLIFGESASSDLPTNNALQPNYGGGETDGWWASWNFKGDLQEASYFGGASRDSISMANRQYGGDLLLAGSSFSSSFSTLQPVSQSNYPEIRFQPIGGSDGFAASIGTGGVTLSPAIVAKGGQVELMLHVNGVFPQGTTFRIDIADPSKARFNNQSRAEAQFPNDFFGGITQGRFFVDGLTEGETTVTVSWPGGNFEQKLRVVKLAAFWDQRKFALRKGDRSTANLRFFWLDPATGDTGPLRCASKAEFFKYQTVTDERIVKATFNNASCASASFYIEAVDNGTATVQVIFPEAGFAIPPLEVNVTGSARPILIDVPPGLSKGLSTNLKVPNNLANLTVTSETPELLKLQHGSNWNTRVALTDKLPPQFGTVGLVGLANAGTAIVRIDAPGIEPIRISIPLSPTTFAVRRFEDVANADGYFSLAALFPRSSAASVNELVKLSVLALPVGVDPRTPIVYVKEPGETSVVELQEWKANGPPTTIASISFNALGYYVSNIAAVGVRFFRAVAQTNPDSNPSLYRLETTPTLVGRVVLLGHNLETSLTLGAGLRNFSLRVVSGDPRVLLAADANKTPSSSVTLSALTDRGNYGQTIYLVSNTNAPELNSVLDVPVSFYVGDALNEVWTVRLVPSSIGFGAFSNSVPFGAKANLGITTYIIDPVSRETRTQQPLRRGLAPIRLTPKISGPAQGSTEAVLTHENPSFSLSLNPTGLGDVIVSVSQPAGFQEPSKGASARISITGYKWIGTLADSGPLVLAPDTQVGFRVRPADGQRAESLIDLEVATEDPTRLLLSLDPLDPGKTSVQFQIGPSKNPPIIYAQAAPGSIGDQVGILIRGATSQTSRIPVSIRPLRIRFMRSNDSSSPNLSTDIQGKDPDFTINPSSAPLQIPLALSVESPDSFLPVDGQVWNAPLLSLRPGATPIEARFTVEGDPGAGILSPAAITFREGDETRNLRFVPIRSGEVTLTPVAGLSASPIRVVVTGPRLRVGRIALGRDLQGQLSVTAFFSDQNRSATVTITSEDPSRLLFRSGLGRFR